MTETILHSFLRHGVVCNDCWRECMLRYTAHALIVVNKWHDTSGRHRHTCSDVLCRRSVCSILCSNNAVSEISTHCHCSEYEIDGKLIKNHYKNILALSLYWTAPECQGSTSDIFCPWTITQLSPDHQWATESPSSVEFNRPGNLRYC